MCVNVKTRMIYYSDMDKLRIYTAALGTVSNGLTTTRLVHHQVRFVYKYGIISTYMARCRTVYTVIIHIYILPISCALTSCGSMLIRTRFN